MSETIHHLATSHTGPATVGAPGQPWLDGPGLATLVRTTCATLNTHGIGRGDRVAIVLPNGPAAATAFIAIAAMAAAAPLNPAYTEAEFEFYLDDLRPRAVIVAAGTASPVRTVASRLAIPLIELTETAPAGAFTLDCTSLPQTPPSRPGPAEPDDEALVLHTSGTTARPKIVPLTGRNLSASAHHIATSLALTADDTCLNVMPLFHIHGLVAATLASLAAGARVCCTPGFNAFRFATWLHEVQPSWYTAVPTMHQAILMRVRGEPAAMRAARLRFIRSSSASLPPQVMTELEDVFAAPVIEAYGMTEAAHQMAANPLPPRPRKPGSVGLPAGPEIAIMNDAGTLLDQGATGEVVIRGPNVTLGYAGNPEATARAFTNGWFRTGDEGRLDADGYLHLTGRLKEMINRGGEKISPLEVDVALLDHPGVAEACTFAVPHAKLGEEVAAIVVPRPGSSLTAQDVRDFAAARLAPFKVPRQILIMDAIPKGATGKVQRIGLAQRLGLVTA
ncbi:MULTISPECIES: acyl--CoA ligase [Acidiphilium]|uniref:Acyl-CoA synthetase (AMP-forming)/AMP-acid ligase II n=1 Tax=Acidiphilium rubrum TaxID=526 RepID=A0A8G2FGI4_ACIRU|nr:MULTISPECIES: acyl--CoA ligase [Acidiphilium]SIQ93714.1 Acyl-CoA synthetase (AMP-forming)/AMP-acid ligase II [Acidiphilium rubrum]